MRVSFIILFITFWLGGSWLLIGAWFHSITPGGWGIYLLMLFLFVFPVQKLIRGFTGLDYPSARTRLWVFRPFWYAMLFIPIIAGGVLTGGLLGLPFSASGSWGRGSVAIIAPILICIAVIGYYQSKRLTIKRLEVKIPRLPASFHGLKMVQISDLHVGPHTSKRFLDRVSEAVQAENPDCVFITGDQVDDFAQDVQFFNDAFSQLRSTYGSFAVAGNHDIYANWPMVHKGLKAAGIEVLVNESAEIKQGDDSIWIVGTGDPAATSLPGEDRNVAPDIDRALEGVPDGKVVVALAHNPALWPSLAKCGVDLTLSGHTHYGQFALPFLDWSLASLFLQYAMGSHKIENALLYINPGTNFWGIPMRFGTPPEVTSINLVSARGADAEIRDLAS